MKRNLGTIGFAVTVAMLLVGAGEALAQGFNQGDDPLLVIPEVFIIVALRCSESRAPSALAASICSAKKARRAATFITAASITSPSRSEIPSLRTVVVPSLPSEIREGNQGCGPIPPCSTVALTPRRHSLPRR